MKKIKSEVVTFKVDDALMDAIKGIPNRSEFIRSAILNALDSVCPLCSGSGIMTLSQKEHWNSFQRDHRLEKCDDCHEFHIVCEKKA